MTHAVTVEFRSPIATGRGIHSTTVEVEAASVVDAFAAAHPAANRALTALTFGVVRSAGLTVIASVTGPSFT
jgi:hypothetical protein